MSLCICVISFLNCLLPFSDSTQQRSVLRSTTSMSGGSSTETWNWTTCCWTRRDTSNLQTTACARFGSQFTGVYCVIVKHFGWKHLQSCRSVSLQPAETISHGWWSLCFCRRAWDRAIRRALSAVPPITSPLKYSEERITVRVTAHKHLPEMLSDVLLSYRIWGTLQEYLSCCFQLPLRMCSGVVPGLSTLFVKSYINKYNNIKTTKNQVKHKRKKGIEN